MGWTLETWLFCADLDISCKGFFRTWPPSPSCPHKGGGWETWLLCRSGHFIQCLRKKNIFLEIDTHTYREWDWQNDHSMDMCIFHFIPITKFWDLIPNFSLLYGVGLASIHFLYRSTHFKELQAMGFTKHPGKHHHEAPRWGALESSWGLCEAPIPYVTNMPPKAFSHASQSPLPR